MVELSPREREILTFEREWWKYADAKDAAARARLGLTPRSTTGRSRRSSTSPAHWPRTRCWSGGCAASG